MELIDKGKSCAKELTAHHLYWSITPRAVVNGEIVIDICWIFKESDKLFFELCLSVRDPGAIEFKNENRFRKFSAVLEASHFFVGISHTYLLKSYLKINMHCNLRMPFYVKKKLKLRSLFGIDAWRVWPNSPGIIFPGTVEKKYINIWQSFQFICSYYSNRILQWLRTLLDRHPNVLQCHCVLLLWFSVWEQSRLLALIRQL